MMYQNMLTLVDVEQVVDQYKELFWAILDKRSANCLITKMSGKLPPMLGANLGP